MSFELGMGVGKMQKRQPFAVFNYSMSRSAFSLITSRLSRAISSCSGFIRPWPGNQFPRILRNGLHPIAQLRRMHVSGLAMPAHTTPRVSP